MAGEEEIITQLSIFVNNEPGRLAGVARTLKDAGVNMKACNLAESTEFGILRALVDDPEGAFEKIRAKGLIVKKTGLVGVRVEDSPGALFGAADVLGRAGINIEYGYAYSRGGVEAFLMRVDDPGKAVKALGGAGIPLVKSSEI
ncbi:MAG: amino acid-binding protein [Candidatus Methanoplasma sp.]|jgi:hypothetical protein|nr:amino acid-binding protein [Candidatus Methanoplasma sp.]